MMECSPAEALSKSCGPPSTIPSVPFNRQTTAASNEKWLQPFFFSSPEDKVRRDATAAES